MISCLLAVFTLQAQAPEGISYQAVARDGSGATLDNQSIDVQFSVRQGSPTGTTVYVETHSTSTNDYGLFALSIGIGSASTGTFSNIDWGSNSYYLQVEVDAGSGFVDLGTTQMMSVPYALYAKEAGNAASYTGGTGINVSGNTITNTGDTDASDDITNSTSAGGDLGGTYPNPDVIGIQGRPVSVNAPTAGQVLKWNGSNWAPGNDNSGGGSYNAGTGIDITGNTISAENNQAIWNANELQGRSVSNAAPGSGQVLKWNGSAWAPAADATGGGGTSVWSTSGSNAFYTTGNVGIGTSSPSEALEVNGIIQLTNTGQDFDIAVANSGDLEFRPNGGTTSALTIQDSRDYVGFFDNLPVTVSSFFDVHADATGTSYGGMYVNTSSATAKPFYGYAANGISRAWTYLDGANGNWTVYNGADRLTVTNAGNVGIGTTSPANQLEVPNGKTVIGSPNGVLAKLTVNSTTTGEDILRLRKSGATQFIVKESGNVGIGTDAPSEKLDVIGNVDVDGDVDVTGRISLGSVEYLEDGGANTIAFNGSLVPVNNFEDLGSAANPWDDGHFAGNVEVEETTTTPNPNTVYGNALPLAYAAVNTAGGITQDYGVATVTNPTTGTFLITLDNSWATGTDPVVMVTCFNSTPTDEIATYSPSGNNQIEVNIERGGNPANSAFSVVIFGTAQ